MKKDLAIFEGHRIRRLYDEKTETWWFSVVDIIRVLTQQPDYQASRKYWKVLKGRLAKEGSELVTNCYQLKMAADDGKQRLTDVANAETLLRLVQSVPSSKAEPIKLWLARVADLERACPGVSRDMIRLRLRDLKAAGHIECLGRGPGAKWRKRVIALKEGKNSKTR
jgi:hypothetical protein